MIKRMKSRFLAVLFACLFGSLSAFANTVSANAVTVPTMPPKKVLTGTKTLYCVVVVWNNATDLTEQQCSNMANYVASFYKRNSGEKLILETHVGTVNTGIDSTQANIAVGEQLAKSTFKADYYIIPNKRGTVNHASGGIAHLIQVLNTVATHEVGHLFGLGHTTKPYGNGYDVESIMNPHSVGSAYLTAPQYYFLGWVSSAETPIYDGASKSVYQLKHPLDQSSAGDTMVIYPQANQAPIFISYPAYCNIKVPCVAIHLSTKGTSPLNGGASQLVSEIPIGSTYLDSTTGLQLEVTPGASNLEVQVSVSKP